MDKQTIFLGFFIALLATIPAASAFAASSYSISVATNAPTYLEGQTVTISGVVRPVPPAGTTVTLKVVGPTGYIYYDSVNPSSTTGDYSFSFVLSPASLWPAGSYSVNVTWAESYQGPYASNTTSFTVLKSPVTVTTVTPAYTLRTFASTPLVPGQTLEVETVAMWDNGSPVTSAQFPVAQFVTPSGSVQSLGSPSEIQKGVYMWSFTLPSSYSTGVYSVMVEGNVSGVTRMDFSAFTVNTGLATASQVSGISSSLSSMNTSLSFINSSLASISGTMTTQYSSIMSSLTSISNMISDLKTSLSSDYSSLSSSLSSLSSSVSTISSASSSISSTVSSISPSVSSLQSSVSSLESSVSSLTTYLLVVAVLAIIIIVLELVLLVRKK
jgi:hypothetical protein